MPSWAAVAVAAVSAVVGGASSAKNADDQKDASRAAVKSDRALQKYMFDQTRADQEPWRKFGQSSLENLSNPLASFYESPDYQFRKSQGLEGIAQSKAVGGLLKSGSALTDTVAYNSNLAAGEFSDFYNRQLAGAGMGQTANSANQQAGQVYANAMQQANQWNANNQIQSSYQRNNAYAQGFGQLAGIAGNALANWGSSGSTTSTTPAINNWFNNNSTWG